MRDTGLTAALRIAFVIAGIVLSMVVAAPISHADPIADIQGTVTRDRSNAHCPGLHYNQTLQDIAFAAAQLIPDPPAKIDGLKQSYGGDVSGPFIGNGDPQADALTKAYQNGGGGAIGNCSITDYGVSFLRNESWDPPDYVGLVFGTPKATPAQSGPPAGQQQTNTGPAQPQTKTCGDGSTIPADQTCPEPPHKCPPGGPQTQVPAGQTCPAPTNAVSMHFVPGALLWTVQLTNSSGVGGNCTYNATDNSGGIGHNDSVNIAPNGKASLQVPGPLPFTTYDVLVSCTGTYDGQQVEFGHTEAPAVSITNHP
jgi:hypothetical protein